MFPGKDFQQNNQDNSEDDSDQEKKKLWNKNKENKIEEEYSIQDQEKIAKKIEKHILKRQADQQRGPIPNNINGQPQTKPQTLNQPVQIKLQQQNQPLQNQGIPIILERPQLSQQAELLSWKQQQQAPLEQQQAVDNSLKSIKQQSQSDDKRTNFKRISRSQSYIALKNQNEGLRQQIQRRIEIEQNTNLQNKKLRDTVENLQNELDRYKKLINDNPFTKLSEQILPRRQELSEHTKNIKDQQQKNIIEQRAVIQQNYSGMNSQSISQLIDQTNEPSEYSASLSHVFLQQSISSQKGQVQQMSRSSDSKYSDQENEFLKRLQSQKGLPESNFLGRSNNLISIKPHQRSKRRPSQSAQADSAPKKARNKSLAGPSPVKNTIQNGAQSEKRIRSGPKSAPKVSQYVLIKGKNVSRERQKSAEAPNRQLDKNSNYSQKNCVSQREIRIKSQHNQKNSQSIQKYKNSQQNISLRRNSQNSLPYLTQDELSEKRNLNNKQQSNSKEQNQKYTKKLQYLEQKVKMPEEYILQKKKYTKYTESKQKQNKKLQQENQYLKQQAKMLEEYILQKKKYTKQKQKQTKKLQLDNQKLKQKVKKLKAQLQNFQESEQVERISQDASDPDLQVKNWKSKKSSGSNPNSDPLQETQEIKPINLPEQNEIQKIKMKQKESSSHNQIDSRELIQKRIQNWEKQKNLKDQISKKESKNASLVSEYCKTQNKQRQNHSDTSSQDQHKNYSIQSSFSNNKKAKQGVFNGANIYYRSMKTQKVESRILYQPLKEKIEGDDQRINIKNLSQIRIRKDPNMYDSNEIDEFNQPINYCGLNIFGSRSRRG